MKTKMSILFFLLFFSATAEEPPFVGATYEDIVREIGVPDNSHDLPYGLQILNYADMTFLYLDVKENRIVFEKSYVSSRLARRLTKQVNELLPDLHGWFHSSHTNLLVRIYQFRGNHIVEIRQENSELAQKIIKYGL